MTENYSSTDNEPLEERLEPAPEQTIATDEDALMEYTDEQLIERVERICASSGDRATPNEIERANEELGRMGLRQLARAVAIAERQLDELYKSKLAEWQKKYDDWLEGLNSPTRFLIHRGWVDPVMENASLMGSKPTRNSVERDEGPEWVPVARNRLVAKLTELAPEQLDGLRGQSQSQFEATAIDGVTSLKK